MVAVVILASVAGAVFLAGAVLFIVGLLQPSTRRRAADSTSILNFLVRNTFKVLFPPPGTSYPRGQRMMAGGLMLIALSILLGLSAVGTSLTQGNAAKSSLPAIAPVTSTQR